MNKSERRLRMWAIGAILLITVLTILFLSRSEAGELPVAWDAISADGSVWVYDPDVHITTEGFILKLDDSSTVQVDQFVRRHVLIVSDCMFHTVQISAALSDSATIIAPWLPVPPLSGYPTMTATSVTPTETPLGQATEITVLGNNMLGAKLYLGSEEEGTWDSYKFKPTLEECDGIVGELLFLDGAKVGDVVRFTVRTDDGQEVILPQALEIMAVPVEYPLVENVRIDR